MIHITKTKNIIIGSDYPVTLNEAKAQMNLCDDFIIDDVFITQLIEDATQEAETYIDSDIALTTTVYEVYDFSSCEVIIEQSPLIAISTVSYLDANGDSQTIDSTDYNLREGIKIFSIEFLSCLNTDKLTITYTSGYATGEDCPATIKQAIRKKITDLYDVARGSYISKAFQDSRGFENALDYFKRRSF